MLIGVLDYAAGNLGSVFNALKRLGADARLVQGPEELLPANSPFDKLLFPGDGHFVTTMAALRAKGYDAALGEWFSADKPFLGICIGLQVLFDGSEEALKADGTMVPGLGLIAGQVHRFSARKVPQIGWNQTMPTAASRLFKGIPANTFFYYIHSYYVQPEETSLSAASADYGLEYCAAVERGNLAAVQFHPEKSGGAGLELLRKWLEA
jgi:imidazole glycerol phosphate synthase glutamine amidotransferase subunit